MKAAVVGRTLALLALASCANAVAQSSIQANCESPPFISPKVLSVPAGESLVLELKSPLNSSNTSKGDRADFSTTNEILVGDQVAIPRATTVRATVTQAKRAGPLGKKPRIGLDFNEIVLPDGTVQPLSANLRRALWSNPKGDHSKARAVHDVMANAASVAMVGVIFGGGRGAARGGTVGAAIGVIGILTRRGPDLDFPPGMMFEIELSKPLDVPVAALARSQLATSHPPPSSPTGSAVTDHPNGSVPPRADEAESLPGANPPAASDKLSKDSATEAANQTPPSTAQATPVSPVNAPGTAGALGGYKLKVDVDLVVVEATVREGRGGIVDNLKREDFHVLEDSVEQQISHFSRDELPLAVALVVDRSGSMAPVLNELRRAAYDTLSLLKPDDQVALFAFAGAPERLEYLTTDRRRIAEDIAAIGAGGGTNIADALFDAALYLGRAASTRRHAIILVSDNENTVPGYASEKDVVRLALETETAIYGIKVGGGMFSRGLPLTLPIIGNLSVPKVARQTGGEVVDANNLGSVQSAMATVIARLKQRYTLGYYSTNRRRDGTFRQIEIRVNDRAHPSTKYAVYARRGYYARTEHVASLGSPGR